MNEPRTEAGKALLKEWESDPYLINRVGSSVADRILAIEAEAAKRSAGAAPLDVEVLDTPCSVECCDQQGVAHMHEGTDR